MYNSCTIQDSKEISIHLQRNLYDLSKIWVTKLQMKLKIIIKEKRKRKGTLLLKVEYPRKLIKIETQNIITPMSKSMSWKQAFYIKWKFCLAQKINNIEKKIKINERFTLNFVVLTIYTTLTRGR